jgi:hypothetical protein
MSGPQLWAMAGTSGHFASASGSLPRGCGGLAWDNRTADTLEGFEARGWVSVEDALRRLSPPERRQRGRGRC